MASHWQKLTIFIVLIVAIAIPVTAAHRRRGRRSDEFNSDDTEQYLRDLCSGSDDSDFCWNIVNAVSRRFHDGSDERDIAGGVIDLAMAKSEEVRDQLKQWSGGSISDRLKDKYDSCSSNYNDIDRDLQEMQKNLDSDDYEKKILKQMKDAEHELEECRREFGPDSVDPAYVRDRNNELRIYLDLVRAATDRLGD